MNDQDAPIDGTRQQGRVHRIIIPLIDFIPALVILSVHTQR